MKQSRAVIQQRREGILRLLKERGEIQVAELSENFSASDMTIRRDLQEMEQRGLLARFHGGARLLRQAEAPAFFEEKDSSQMHEKAQIAAVIASLIEPGTTLFCNAGTTTLAVMNRLRDKNLRIITNNAMAQVALGGSDVELISTGGQYSSTTRSYYGDFSTHVIGKVHADYCILGANGISLAGGLTTAVYNETEINGLMAKRCQGKRIVAADGSKVGRTFCFTSVPLHKLDILVTDSSADPEELDRIRDSGLEVILADKV